MKITFYTKLSIDECIKKIKENPKNVEFSSRITTLFNADKELFYKIDNDSIRLEKAIISQNIFKPIFYGKFKKSSKNTCLEGEFRKSPLAKIFVVTWYTFLIFVGGGGLIAFAILPDSVGSPIMLLLVTMFFLIVGMINFKWMTHQANDYKKQTISFIEKSLGAAGEGLKHGSRVLIKNEGFGKPLQAK